MAFHFEISGSVSGIQPLEYLIVSFKNVFIVEIHHKNIKASLYKNSFSFYQFWR